MTDFATFFRDYTNAELQKYIDDMNRSIDEYQKQIDSIDHCVDPCCDSWLMGNAKHSYWKSQQDCKRWRDDALEEQRLRAALPQDPDEARKLREKLHEENEHIGFGYEAMKQFIQNSDNCFRLIRIEFGKY